jgi:ketosteroid isomerase-like protein
MKSVTFILAAIVLASVSRACFADANADAKKAIQAAANKAMQYIVKEDFDSLTKMCTADCTFTDSGQTMDVKQMVSMMKAEMAKCKDTKMASTILTCSVKGNIATCTTHDIMSTSEQGPDKKWHKFMTDGTSKDTFTKSGNIWLMKSSITVSEKMTMDGKPYDPKAAAAAGGQKKE